MDNLILKSYSKILSPNVSRETCNEFERLISMIQEKNREINIISKKMYEKEAIRERHIIDSAQIIDFVDLNYQYNLRFRNWRRYAWAYRGYYHEKIKKEHENQFV